MTEPVKIVENRRLALTQTELGQLKELLDAGDRAGFYLAYYGMTGNTEALLTARITTFSGLVGGTAYAANWLLNDRFKLAALPGPPAGPSYAGMYLLSQKVAEASFKAIENDLNKVLRPNGPNDTIDDGLVDQNRLVDASRIVGQTLVDPELVLNLDTNLLRAGRFAFNNNDIYNTASGFAGGAGLIGNNVILAQETLSSTLAGLQVAPGDKWVGPINDHFGTP